MLPIPTCSSAPNTPARWRLYMMDDQQHAMDNTRTQFLVLRAQTGDRVALDLLLLAVQSDLHRYLARMLGDTHGADDALQDVLVILCRTLRGLREPAYFRSWAYRVASREALRRLRKQSGRAELEWRDDTHAPGDAPAEAAERREGIDGLVGRVSNLPPNSRAVVLLHYMAGMSLADVAAVLDVPPGTAKSRLAYALQHLRRGTGDAP
jgi:RNA polymerase sigma factor (sigma-70 family)